MTKKIISVLMALSMMVTTFILPVSAASKKTVYLSTNRSWSSAVTCTLNSTWRDGYVRASIPNWGVNVDVRMTNKNGSTLWSQNNAINGNNYSATTYRDFYLGKNNKTYKLYFRCSKKCSCAPYVSVTNRSNVNIS